jgi:uncharacterized ferredoxin-like protein
MVEEAETYKAKDEEHKNPTSFRGTPRWMALGPASSPARILASCLACASCGICEFSTCIQISNLEKNERLFICSRCRFICLCLYVFMLKFIYFYDPYGRFL